MGAFVRSLCISFDVLVSCPHDAYRKVRYRGRFWPMELRQHLAIIEGKPEESVRR